MKRNIKIIFGSLVAILIAYLIIRHVKNAVHTYAPISHVNSYNLVFTKGTKEKKLVALTFDDGPHPEYTPQLLDLLNEYDAKATFFILGKQADLYPDLVKREFEEGHEIGNHSYSHIDVKKVSKEKIEEEFEKTQDIIYSIIESKPSIFRPPYGFYNNKVKEIAEKNEIKVILWTVDSKDWSSPGVKKIIDTTVTQTEQGNIVLLHDHIEGDNHTIDALKVILSYFKAQGYRFVTVSQLLDLSKD